MAEPLHAFLVAYMQDCRAEVLAEIRAMLPASRRHDGGLWDLVLDYPLREAKALRPALCIATCRALGGPLDAVVRTAAAIELYHNAFLVHDDVEDGSELRRHRPTLNRLHGDAIAINVGDGMLALALRPLLDNMEAIGLGRALRTLELVARMATETAEGQALELGWIRDNDWSVGDRDYLRMVYKKTAWYSFVAPILAGAAATGAADGVRRRLWAAAATLGIAFQIQDDVLNLDGDAGAHGKEADGDLWEGKHTLILIHALRSASPEVRADAVVRLGRTRPSPLRSLLDDLAVGGIPDPNLRRRLDAAREVHRPEVAVRTAEDVATLRALIADAGSLRYARGVAGQHASLAMRALDDALRDVGPSVHTRFLRGVVEYVVDRDR